MIEEEESATLDSQFVAFSKFLDHTRDGLTITLRKSDYWMRQAKLLDDRKLTMTDTGVEFNRCNKVELSYEEWLEFVNTLLEIKKFEKDDALEQLINCGLPGSVTVDLPAYRVYFDTFKRKERLLF